MFLVVALGVEQKCKFRPRSDLRFLDNSGLLVRLLNARYVGWSILYHFIIFWRYRDVVWCLVLL